MRQARRYGYVAVVFASVVFLFLLGPAARAGEVSSVLGLALDNGDVNGDATRDVSDGIHLLEHLYSGGSAPVPLMWCAAGEPGVTNGDINADGSLDISDPVSLLNWLFLGGREPARPCDVGGNGAARIDNPRVLPPNATAYGKSLGDWGAAWWVWALSLPITGHPVLDLTGDLCDVGQSGPVWFLSGTFGGAAERTCQVPPGTALCFPLINTECSTVEPPPFFGSNEEELLVCNDVFYSPDDPLTCTVDGVDLGNLHAYRAQSAVTDFSTPPEDNLLGLPGVTSGQIISDGYWILLAPLSHGEHTIHFTAAFAGGPFAGFAQDSTYSLIVGD